MELIFGLVVFILGIIVGVIIMYRRNDGILKIDHRNPVKDVYRIEVYDIYGLPRRKRVMLRVEDNADLSHE